MLSHQHSKIVAANRSGKQRWAYIWMFFNALTVMWSTTNMQKFREKKLVSWGKRKKNKRKKPHRIESRFAQNMDRLYLASELPWGENCHVLAIDVLQLWEGRGVGWGLGGVSTQKCRVVEDRQCDWAWGTVEYMNIRGKDSNPQGPKEATTGRTAAAAAFSSDKSTSEWQESQERRRKGKKNKRKTKRALAGDC